MVKNLYNLSCHGNHIILVQLNSLDFLNTKKKKKKKKLNSLESQTQQVKTIHCESATWEINLKNHAF